MNLVDEVIEEKKYDRDKLNKDWILVFDQCIYNLPDIAKYSNQRKFSDFDVATSLMYSLTWDNITDENILFAFDCVKRIINEPKEYLVYSMHNHVDEMEVANKFETLNINIPDESITSEALTLIIKTYLTQNTYRGISKFSDFLRILYLSRSDFNLEN